jgi:hypothetical protein
MPPSVNLKIRQSGAGSNPIPLLNSAAVAGRRKGADLPPPPEVTMKKKFLGLENGLAIYAGIAIAAAILIPLAGVALKQKLAWALSHFDKPKPEPIVQASPATALPSPQPVKIPLPPIRPGTFKVTSILLADQRLAVINGKELSEGDPVPVSGQPGWKIAQIRDDSVVLDYYGNLVGVGLTILDSPGPLNDQLQPLK